MSLLPPQAIDEFQDLWQHHFGTDLSREEAVVRAQQVFTLVQMLVKSQAMRADEAQPASRLASREIVVQEKALRI